MILKSIARSIRSSSFKDENIRDANAESLLLPAEGKKITSPARSAGERCNEFPDKHAGYKMRIFVKSS